MRLLSVLMAAAAALVLTSSPPAEQLRVEGRPTLPRPALLKGLFAGQRHLITDYFWLTTINKVGSAKSVTDHRDLYWHGDFVTDLDPDFELVYTFTAQTIPFAMPDGSFANLAEAEALLLKGIEHHPSNRKMLFQLAFNRMFYEGRYGEAARLFEQLALDPTSPSWYSALATRLYAAGGELEASEYLTRKLLESCFEPETCESYERRLLEIHQEGLLREIDTAIARFKSTTGQFPTTVEALLEARLIPGPPQDPLGGEVYIGDDGRGHATSSKRRLELLRENQPLAAPPMSTP